ncbi:hypothetical protein BDW22DRAFT_1358368 [Trametopsis cervina]|nr:hypothetical protein BDW22DRAFT_1358368 [Trametopsis cervina]
MLIASVTRRHPSRCLKALWRKQLAPRRLHRAAPCITPSSSAPASRSRSPTAIPSPTSSRSAPHCDTATSLLRSIDSARTSFTPPLSTIPPPLSNVHVGISTMQPTPTNYTRRQNTSTLRNDTRKTRRGTFARRQAQCFDVARIRILKTPRPHVCTQRTTQHLGGCNTRPSKTRAHSKSTTRRSTFAPPSTHRRWTCAGNSDVPNAPPRAQVPSRSRRRPARQDGGVMRWQWRRALQDTHPRTFASASRTHQHREMHDVPTSNRPASDVRLVTKSR